jgi:hypothetical protein
MIDKQYAYASKITRAESDGVNKVSTYKFTSPVSKFACNVRTRKLSKSFMQARLGGRIKLKAFQNIKFSSESFIYQKK